MRLQKFQQQLENRCFLQPKSQQSFTIRKTFLVRVEPRAIQIKILKWDNVHCLWTYLSSVAILGQQNLLLPIKAPPNLVASAVILIIYRGWAQRRGSSAAHGVSWASPPSWYLPSGVSTDMAGTSLTFLSLGSLSSSGGQNSFKSSSGLHGRHSRRTNPNA